VLKIILQRFSLDSVAEDATYKDASKQVDEKRLPKRWFGIIQRLHLVDIMVKGGTVLQRGRPVVPVQRIVVSSENRETIFYFGSIS